MEGVRMSLYIVGFGCGSYANMTIQARESIERCGIVVGYTVYTDIVQRYFPNKVYISTGMTKEVDRCKLAIEKTLEGNNVALVCSGDSVIYGMASLVYQLAEDYPPFEIYVVSGVTSAISGSALLGSPITNDFAVVSLSDLLTPKSVIQKRIEGASLGDYVLCLYNPSSKKRADYLAWACDIVLKYRDASTVCGYAQNIGRDGESYNILTLGELRDTQVDMFTTVYIGNSQTRVIHGKMVTPRGYSLDV
jgi:precorrin-3B C17-methyltransferase